MENINLVMVSQIDIYCSYMKVLMVCVMQHVISNLIRESSQGLLFSQIRTLHFVTLITILHSLCSTQYSMNFTLGRRKAWDRNLQKRA